MLSRCGSQVWVKMPLHIWYECASTGGIQWRAVSAFDEGLHSDLFPSC